jgi:dolichyl-phosphate-mannose--protein O-mannosyl transferase
MIDMYEAFWIMAGLVCTWRYVEAPPGQVKWACWAGAAFGWGLATKWSTLFAMVGALTAVALLKPIPESPHPARARLRMLLCTVAVGGALAACMYVVSYLPLWRADQYNLDHTLADVKFYYTQMWSFRYDPHQFRHRYMSQWWEWPLCYRPIWYVYQEEGTSCRGEVALGNPVTWLFFLACLPLCARSVWRRQNQYDRALAFATVTYVPQVALWSINQGFVYYMLPVVPLMALVIGLVLYRWKQSPIDLAANSGLLVAAFAWTAVFYPLTVGAAVPKAYFESLMLLRSWI